MISLNDVLASQDLGHWKGLVSMLLLPPVPMIVLALVGTWWVRTRRRLLGWATVLLGALLTWLTSTTGLATALEGGLLQPPPALSAGAIEDLRAAAREGKTAVVVLGAGREVFAPEYGLSNLTPLGIERLRYGVWLSRQTALPLAYSGGIGHGAPQGATEAEIATRIASQELGRPLRWTEGRSRDTRENASFTVPMLHEAGVRRIVLVTHAFHMRRAQRAFQWAAERDGLAMEIVPAPMGLGARSNDWTPSGGGFMHTRLALREALGLLAGS
jgi:uncharacterized SAM-binding protein YcdF (DUF218 family)